MASSGLGSAMNPVLSTQIATVSRNEANALMRQVNRLLNRQLSSVCQVNGVKSTGIKAELQKRIANLIQEAVDANDPVRFQQIRQSVHNTISNAPAGASLARTNLSQPYSMQSMSFSSSSPGSTNGHRSSAGFGGSQSMALSFKSSPFYKIEATIGEVRACDAMSQHRNTVSIPIKLNDHPSLQNCVDDTSYRVMVFCAGDCTAMQDIAFPHQSELKVNGGEIKANLRGLKNKPGSTRPVDITKALRLRPHYANNVEFTYALTNKKFYLVLNLCRVTTVDELVTRISTGRRIPIDSVKKELNAKAQDPDVVATSQVLSLKCPLSYMRLSLPCRGLSCSHIQCFDATSYLQLQEQGPQWQCPICSKMAPFDQLAVDEYVKDILTRTSKSLESVTIEPDGEWHLKNSDESLGLSNGNSSYHDDYDDDDDVLISEVNPIGHRRLETPKNTSPSIGTPVTAGRDGSSSGPRGTSSISGKRPVAAIIDLTLSDDDDEPSVQPPPKRQNTATNGFYGSINLPSNLALPPNSPGGYL
ncbi:E3 SUMO-protein ligase pli1 [Fusarium piperis]|uniref:E3 SUMO-protein ligase pli1 n=1 Tax=Fusarium piperis TaxID=1435070 RepID=A0A9W9BQ06_9HYPO|nr:E3 SUMO-protein ligase pli1 [Fusarium piperis]